MLSVLIPVYNYDVAPLAEAIIAQCNDAGIRYEIVVADDASAIPAEINTHSNARLLLHPVNIGRTATRALLAKEAAYDMLLFLDADVLPADEQFIARYITFIEKKEAVVFGGYAYQETAPPLQKRLRYAYGKGREQRTADSRKRNPYNVFSGNLLIRKDIFVKCNPGSDINGYGLDIIFNLHLHQAAIIPVHIDNPILHLGLEDNVIFLAKALESVAMRRDLLQRYPDLAQINSLCRHYKRLKQLKLDFVTGLAFRAARPVMLRLIMNANPSLTAFDLYRLGYMCSLK